MPCYHPLTGYLARDANPSGKRSIVFDPKLALGVDVVRQVPCGQCIGCRLERARQWAVRCLHEAKLWPRNCFITLTYSDDLSAVTGLKRSNDSLMSQINGSLCVGDFQNFMKRLRKKYGNGIRYFHCGEYGDQFKRPHFHACLFNFDFEDKLLWSIRSGVKLYRSKSLESLWPFGFSTVGEVTYDSACYVARYCVKKVNGVAAEKHYNGRKPEYVTMSRRPGIAADWVKKWYRDVYPHDFIVVNGFEGKPPRYYDSIFELTDGKCFGNIKAERKLAAIASPDNSHSRLRAREVVQELRCKQLKRGYENGSSGV